jgi:hypothetical protein
MLPVMSCTFDARLPLTFLQQPLEVSQEMASVDVFEVDLVKDSKGLGITIAGYVGGDNTPGQSSS